MRHGDVRLYLGVVTVVLAFLALVFHARGAEVFPKRMCEKLPEVGADVKAWVAEVAPELARVPVRELSEKTALEVFGRAADAGWGGIDLFTQDVFREACVFHLPAAALRALDAAFEFELLTVIRGEDKEGETFEMRGMLAGHGKLLLFYDRDDIVYRNEIQRRDFRLASRVEFDSPGRGRLENVRGLCVKVALLGCIAIRSMVKNGGKVTVRAGLLKSASPLQPIRRRGTPAGRNRGPAWKYVRSSARSRTRRAASTDRVRVTVTKRIRTSIDHIRA